jgi:integrase
MGAYKRANKWWFRVGYKGQEYREGGFRTRREAEKAMNDRLKQLEDGEAELHEPVSFTVYAEIYLDYCVTNKARRTADRERFTIRKHLNQYFGDRKLNGLTTKDIEDFKRSRHAASRGTLNRELDTLKAMLTCAVKWNYISKSPANQVSKVPNPPQPPVFLNAVDCGRLLQACAHSRNVCLHSFVATALYTGLRKDELFHLEWDDIDLEQNTVRIVNKTRLDWHTKSYTSRTIPISHNLKEILAAHPKHPDSSFVFYNRNGTRFHDIRNGFNNALKRAGLPHITIHALRHTFASLLIMGGADLPAVQRLLGHRDISTTMRYAHLAPDHLHRTVEKLDFGPDDSDDSDSYD